MHRLFLDQNVRVEIAEALRDDGHEVVHASGVSLDRHDDESVFRWAVEKGLTLVTFDVWTSPKKPIGVVNRIPVSFDFGSNRRHQPTSCQFCGGF